MDDFNLFPDSIFHQMYLGERELSAFVGAVRDLLGPSEARIAAENWLEEFEQLDKPCRSTARGLRAITIAAASRLANGRKIELGDKNSLGANPPSMPHAILAPESKTWLNH